MKYLDLRRPIFRAPTFLVCAILAVAGCAADRRTTERIGSTAQAVWTNGDFEGNAIGATPPTGWTVQQNLNPNITDTRPNPQTLASLNLAAGGTSMTYVVGGATESQTDPDLGTNGTIRFPKYGQRAVRVNYLNAATPGNNRNVNTLTQSMTVGLGDVDPTDNKVHVRFALAPILENPGHAYVQQPYYFVRLLDVTTGQTLYQDFNASGQPGVPWKNFTDSSGQAAQYTDWQLVDVAPGNALLAVGDQVELRVVASGCAAGGHWGRVYLDAVGSGVPGLYAWATGPQQANAGSIITYDVNYKNGGTQTTSGTQIDFVTPPNTTFQSVSLAGACTAPAVGATGTVSCSLGTLAQGATGSFTVTVNIPAGTANGTLITNGNYSIYASGVSALIGPKVNTTVTSGVQYADLSVTKTDGVAAIGWGQADSYTVTVSNAGPVAASTVTVTDPMPAQLTGVSWTCAASPGAACTGSGTGNINDGAVSLPVGATVTYTIGANVIAGSGSGTVVNAVSVAVGGGVTDPDTTNNSAVDTDSIGTLRTLAVTKTGDIAAGTVSSVPSAISCGTSCSSGAGQFLDGSQVVLSASPIAGATFVGWSGACSGTSATCTVTMNGAQSVLAMFVGPAAAVAVSSGSPQTAAVGTAFGAPLSVLVTDSAGDPVSGAIVTFTVPSSGATATLSAASATTNASGVASVQATAGAVPGGYNVTAEASGVATGVSFGLTNVGTPASIAIVSGAGQSATAGTPFGSALTALVLDAANNPVSGATVSFFAPASGATAALSAPSAITDASGQASVTATANAVAGTYSVTASVSGVSSPASAGLTNTPAAAANLTISGASTQSATVGTSFGAPLAVSVTDTYGNAIAGATVSFATPPGGPSASLSAPTAVTDSSGAAAVAATAGWVAGGYSVTATVAGVPGSVSFALANMPGAPVAIAVAAGSGQSILVGSPFGSRLAVSVVDSFGNAAPGATVSFAAPPGAASAVLSAALVVTDASGLAAVSATATLSAGSYAVLASLGAAPPVSFNLTNAPGPAASIGASGGGGQRAVVGTAFSAPIVATVVDSFGNAVPGVVVSFGDPPGGASALLDVASTTTDASGRATVNATANSVAGGYTVTATVGGSVASFSLTNVSAAAARVSALSGTPQTATVEAPFGAPLVVAVADAYGNAVAGATVAFAAPPSGPSAALAAQSVATDASGHASVAATANTLAGAYAVVASVPGAASSASFALTNAAGAPASIVSAGGGGQSQAVTMAFPAPLIVAVADAHGNPVPDVSVSYSAPAAGPSASLGGAGGATTDSGGRASVPATANSVAGSYVVTATVTGLPAAASFNLTNTAGAPARLVVSSGDAQQALVSTAFAQPLVVAVLDSNSNPVRNAAVTFAAPRGASRASASLSALAAATNAQGQAEVTATANTVAGAFSVTATVQGALPVSFALTNRPDTPATMTVAANASPQATTVDSAFVAPLLVTVQDRFGNPVPQTPVQYGVPTGGATAVLSAASGQTDDRGQASVTATAGSSAGSYAVTASVLGTPLATRFALTNLSGPAVTVAAASGTPQTAVGHAAFAQALDVLVSDARGNPVGGATVSFSVASASAATCFLAASSATTDASGHAAVGCTAGTVNGTYDVAASVSNGSQPAVFALTNTPGPAAVLVPSPNSTPQSAVVDTAYVQALALTVRDGFGNAVPGVRVTYGAPAAGATASLAASELVSDADGQTSTVATAGPVSGAFSVTASVPQLPSVAFALTNLSAPASVVAIDSGSPQSTAVHTDFALPLAVVVRDAYGNAAPNVGVTFAAPGAGPRATLSATSVKTDVDGRAQTSATAGTIAGAFEVTAVAEHAATPIAFQLTSVAGAPSSVSAAAGSTPQSAQVGLPFAQSLGVLVTDVFANPAPGVAVHFEPPSADPTAVLVARDAVTDKAGRAAVAAAASGVAGSYSVIASVGIAPAGGSKPTALFALSNVASQPGSVQWVRGETQHAMATTPFAAPLTVRVVDGRGNPTVGTPVVVTLPTGGPSASLDPASVTTTDSDGQADILLVANEVPGAFTVSVSVPGVAAPATTDETVDAIPTTVTAHLGATDLSIDRPIAVDVMVASPVGTPAGSVTILADGVTVVGHADLEAGQARTSVSMPGVGQHQVTVSYLAAGSFGASTSTAIAVTSEADSGQLSGGACEIVRPSTRSARPPWLSVALALFGAAFAARRRRRRRRGRERRSRTTAAVIVALAASLLTIPEARAQGAGGMAIERFHPAAAGSDWFALDSLSFEGHLTTAAILVSDYAYAPLVINDANGARRTWLVRHSAIVHAGASLALYERIRVSLELPMAPFQNGDGGTFNGERIGAPAAGFGDLAIGADARVLGDSAGPLQLALGARATLPTGSFADMLGDGVVGVEPRALLAGERGPFVYAAQAGVLVRPAVQMAGLRYGSELRAAAGAGIRLFDGRLRLGPEVLSAWALETTDPHNRPALEADGGAHYALLSTVTLGAGAGVGIVNAVGTPDFRALVSVDWRPNAVSGGEPIEPKQGSRRWVRAALGEQPRPPIP